MRAATVREPVPPVRRRGVSRADEAAALLQELPQPSPHPETIQRALVEPAEELGPGAEAYADLLEEDADKPLPVQRATAGAATDPPEEAVQAAQQDSSPGEPLASGVRSRMEDRFGYDFGAVRVHTDLAAARLAEDVYAEAFTRGADIYFAAGAFQPSTPAGRALLVHELQHVVQQATGVQLPGGIDQGDDAYEMEAQAAQVEEETTTFPRLPLPSTSGSVVQRQSTGEGPTTPHSASPAPAPSGGAASAPLGPASPAPSGTASSAPSRAASSAPSEAASPTPSGPSSVVSAPTSASTPAGSAPRAGGAAAETSGGLPDASAPPAPLSDLMSTTQVPLVMPEAPAALSSDAQAGLDAALAATDQVAALTLEVPSAEQSVADAQASVAHPAEQLKAEGAGVAAQALDTRPPPSPEIEAFCQRVQSVIHNKRPVDEDALARANPDAAADEARREMQNSVQGEVASVEGEYATLQQEPAPTAAPPTTPIPETPAAVATPPIDAAAAAPTPIPDEQLSLDQDVANADRDIREAGMDTETAQLVQEGPIAEARGARGELGEVAQADIEAARARQEEAIASARADMAALQARGEQALTDARAANVQQAGLQQAIMSGDETAMRIAAAKEAELRFSSAQDRIRNLLQPLANTATTRWETEMVPIKAKFRADLAEVVRRVEERHAGLVGAFRAMGDAIFGLPAWATKAYNEAEQNFADSTCALIKDISRDVNQVIQSCETIITETDEAIADIFAQLPQSLHGWAAEQRTAFSGRLAALKGEVQQARTDINTGLTDRAGEAIDEVRREVAAAREKAGGLLGRILAAVEEFAADPARFLINGLLALVNISPPAFWAVVDKIGPVIDSIADNPMGFANNLVGALKQGFQQFFANFPSHMAQGFFDWLFSDLGSVGVQIPTDFSLKSLITFFLQLMGISWPRIRGLLAKHIGEENVALIEKAWSVVSMLIEQGPQGIFDMIKEKLSPESLLQMVMDAAIQYIVETLIKQAAAKVVAMMSPAGWAAEALRVVYQVLRWVFNNAARIFALVETVVNGAAELVAGNIGGMATAVEGALARVIPPVIDFFAGLIGLGDLPEKVAKTIGEFQEMVLGVLDDVIGWLAEQGRRLLAAVGLGGDENGEQEGSDDGEIGAHEEFSAGGEDHTIWVDTSGVEPVVMMASTPRSLSDHLATLRRRRDAMQALAPEQAQQATDLIEQVFPLARTVVQHASAAREHPVDSQERMDADGATEAAEAALKEPLRALLELMGVEIPKELDPAVVVNFHYPRRLAEDPNRHDRDTSFTHEEMERQLEDQENGLNEMNVGEWQHNRERYIERRAESGVSGGGRDPKAARYQAAMRTSSRERVIDRLTSPTFGAQATSSGRSAEDQFVQRIARRHPGNSNGLSYAYAEALVDDWMEYQHVLHAPDQVAGGKGSALAGVGNARVNSSIGWQWGPGGRVQELDGGVQDRLHDIPRTLWAEVGMKVKLTVS